MRYRNFTVAGALLLAVALIATASFFTSPVFGQRVGNTNDGNGGVGGVIQATNCSTGLVACDTPTYLCPVGTFCVPSGAPGCGTCQGTVVGGGGTGGDDGCQFDVCTNPNGTQYCKPFLNFQCPTGGQPFSFSISSNHAVGQPLAVLQGTNENVTITLDLIGGGATQSVSLSSQILQKIGGGSFTEGDIGRGFSQSSCNPTCTSTMVVTGNVVGNYVVRVTGTSGAITKTTDVYVYVQSPPPAECLPDSSPLARDLCGFAWGATDEGPASENGVGWLSFNSSDCDPDADGMTNVNISGCPSVATTTAQYKVNVSNDGSLKGCAWSPNIGWVKFSNLSNFPSYPNDGNVPSSARLASGAGNAGQTTTLEGWARACAGTTSGDCSNMNDRADGWDGWISLKNGSIANQNASVTFTEGIFGGNAWGSEVVGWLGFNSGNASAVRMCTVQLFDFGLNGASSVSVAQGGTAQLPLTVAKIGTAAGQPVALTWSIVSGPTTGTLSPTLSPTSGTPNPSYSSNLSIAASSNVPPTTPGAPYVIRVTGTAGSVVRTKDISVSVVAGTTSSELDLVCTPPVGGVGYVNKPVTFGVEARPAGTPPSSPTANFYFTTTINGSTPPDPSPGSPGTSMSSTNPLSGVSRIFTTIGRKTLKIKVIDSSTPVARGECSVDVLIKVNPDINER